MNIMVTLHMKCVCHKVCSNRDMEEAFRPPHYLVTQEATLAPDLSITNNHIRIQMKPKKYTAE